MALIGVGHMDLTRDALGDELQQVRLIGHVAVQRHRFAAKPAGDGAHRDGVKPTLIDEAQRALHNRVAGQPLHAYSVSASLAYTVSRKRGMKPYLLSALAAGLALNNTWGRRNPKPPPPGRFADIGGRRIHYSERPGEGPPVVLLHGMPGTHLDFAGVVEALPGRHTVAVDRPGYGWSQGGPLDYQAQIALIPTLLDALGLGRAVLAGHSFGGLVALGVAVRHPETVAGLALIAPSGGGL